MVAVAQLVESRIVIPVVVGSSPISHPKNSSESPVSGLGFLLSCFWLDFSMRRGHACPPNPAPCPAPLLTPIGIGDGPEGRSPATPPGMRVRTGRFE